MIELILDSARSGKSSYAEKQGALSNKQHFYIATAQALDDEMAKRIAHHQQHRDTHWQTIETPITLAATLKEYDQADRIILIDCLTLWLTNCLLANDPSCWQTEKQALLNTLPTLQADILLVSNETSLGIVPLDPLSRRFVDEAGWLHQAIAQVADKVTFVAAGLPLTLKA